MKKQIGYINLDSSTAEWLRANLPKSEFKTGLEKLIQGEFSSLMVEADESAVGAVSEAEISCGDLVISEKSRQVLRDGTAVSLTPKEFDILLFLARNRGEVFTKEQIYQAVWDNDYVMDDSNIMAFIRKLRKKIEPNPDAPEYILTIWGIGYKFNDKL